MNDIVEHQTELLDRWFEVVDVGGRDRIGFFLERPMSELEDGFAQLRVDELYILSCAYFEAMRSPRRRRLSRTSWPVRS
jgi:hypothetical protein